MNYSIPLKAFADGVFAQSQAERPILVLKAFFDDSGTHASSQVIVMGGILADESVWASLEADWAKVVGDFGVSRMHMSHCENGNWKSGFGAFSREQRNHLVRSTSEVITRRGTEVQLICAAVNREVWDSVSNNSVLGDMFSEPLDFCFNYCLRKAALNRQKGKNADDQVLIVFDSRDQNVPKWSKLASGYESLWGTFIAGYSFAASSNSPALQAADMVAYETYKYMSERDNVGFKPRDNWLALTGACAFDGGHFRKEELWEYVHEVRKNRLNSSFEIPARS